MNRLKEVLDEQGRRQKWLCQQIGRTMTAVNAWCQNKAQPSVTVLFKIAVVLGVEARELLMTMDEVDHKKLGKNNGSNQN